MICCSVKRFFFMSVSNRDRDANSFMRALDLAPARTPPQQVESAFRARSRAAPRAKRLKALARERYVVSSPISDLQRAMVANRSHTLPAGGARLVFHEHEASRRMQLG